MSRIVCQTGLNRSRRNHKTGSLYDPEFRRQFDMAYRTFFKVRGMPMPDGTFHYGEKALNRRPRK